MARPKKDSDITNNARKRLKTAHDRAKRAGVSDFDLWVFERNIQALRGKVTPEKLAKAREVLSMPRGAIEVTKSARPKRNAILRAREIFKQRLNTAGTIASDITKADRDTFFAATKQIWAANDAGSVRDTPDDRHERIMKHLYTGASADAKRFQQFLRENGYSRSNRDIELVFYWVTRQQPISDIPESYDGGTPIDFITLNYIR